MSLCVPFTRGVLYTGLVLAHGENLSVFRKCLYEEIVTTLRICTGAPSPAAVKFRMAMIDLFASTIAPLCKV